MSTLDILIIFGIGFIMGVNGGALLAGYLHVFFDQETEKLHNKINNLRGAAAP